MEEKHTAHGGKPEGTVGITVAFWARVKGRRPVIKKRERSCMIILLIAGKEVCIHKD